MRWQNILSRSVLLAIYKGYVFSAQGLIPLLWSFFSRRLYLRLEGQFIEHPPTWLPSYRASTNLSVVHLYSEVPMRLNSDCTWSEISRDAWKIFNNIRFFSKNIFYKSVSSKRPCIIWAAIYPNELTLHWWNNTLALYLNTSMGMLWGKSIGSQKSKPLVHISVINHRSAQHLLCTIDHLIINPSVPGAVTKERASGFHWGMHFLLWNVLRYQCFAKTTFWNLVELFQLHYLEVSKGLVT